MKTLFSDLIPVQISTPSVHRLGLMLTCCQSKVDIFTLPIHNQRNEEFLPLKKAKFQLPESVSCLSETELSTSVLSLWGPLITQHMLH